MSYQDKIELKLNDLQKEFFRLFRKTFPDFSDKIQIEKGIIHADNFCFSVKSISQVFGKLSFDIDDTQITVFTDFDHSHFATYYFIEVKNKNRQILLTCEQALIYIKDFICGNIIIEYVEQDGKILESIQYYKDKPISKSSTPIILNQGRQETLKSTLFTKVQNLFRRKQKNNTTIVTRKINWFGEIG